MECGGSTPLCFFCPPWRRAPKRRRLYGVRRLDAALLFCAPPRLILRTRCLGHLVPHTHLGSNPHRNLVSCCNDCNSNKADRSAVEHVRSLYRDRRLSSDELTNRLRALDHLAAGKRPPQLPIHKGIGSKRFLTPNHELPRPA